MINHDLLALGTYELAPLPASVVRLLGLLSSDDWSLDSVVATASLDATLTARILKVANSAANSSVSPVTTLHEATMRLGATTVVKLATGSALRHHMVSDGAADSEVDEQSLWRISVATAIAADFVTAKTSVDVPKEAFTVALLNDIGRIVLTQHLDKKKLRQLECAVEAGDQNPLEAEREVLGVDHAELGALIADYWELPPLITQSIRFHHTPTQADDEDTQMLCHVITIADVASRIVTGENAATMAFDCSASREVLGIDDATFEELCEKTSERLDQAMAEYE